MPRVRHISRELQQAAWRLRDVPTPAETALWEALRLRRLDGLRFRRQHPVGTFVLDFYCAEHKLVVEVDGEIHGLPDQRLRDEERTQMLEVHGYRVVRVHNDEVLAALPLALERIRQAIRAGRVVESRVPDGST